MGAHECRTSNSTMLVVGLLLLMMMKTAQTHGATSRNWCAGRETVQLWPGGQKSCEHVRNYDCERSDRRRRRTRRASHTTHVIVIFTLELPSLSNPVSAGLGADVDPPAVAAQAQTREDNYKRSTRRAAAVGRVAAAAAAAAACRIRMPTSNNVACLHCLATRCD